MGPTPKTKINSNDLPQLNSSQTYLNVSLHFLLFHSSTPFTVVFAHLSTDTEAKFVCCFLLANSFRCLSIFTLFIQSCAGKMLNKLFSLQGKMPWFAAFANFCGVNTPTGTGLRLWMWCHWAQRWTEREHWHMPQGTSTLQIQSTWTQQCKIIRKWGRWCVYYLCVFFFKT